MFSPFKQIKRYVILKASWTRRRMGSHGVLDSEVFETPRVRLMCRVRSCCLCDSVAFKNMFYVYMFSFFTSFAWKDAATWTSSAHFQTLWSSREKFSLEWKHIEKCVSCWKRWMRKIEVFFISDFMLSECCFLFLF